MSKRLFVIVGALLLSLAPSIQAGPGGCTNAGSLFPFADQTLTVSSTALPLTATVYAPDGQKPADMAVCNVETDSIRFRVNGLNPTAAVGQIVLATAAAPASFTACGEASIRRIRLIRVTADSSVTCTYYRDGDN